VAAPRNAAPAPNLAPVILAGAIIAGLAGSWFHLPGALITWLGVIVAAWSSSPPMLTGKKDAAGYPTVGNPSERSKQLTHRKWQQLRTRLILSPDWLMNPAGDLPAALNRARSSLRKLVAFLSWALIPSAFTTACAIGIGAVVFTLPVDQLAAWGVAPDSGAWLMWPNAAAAYVLVQQSTVTARRFASPEDPAPAIGWPQLVDAAKRKGASLVALIAGAIVAGVVTAVVITVVLNGFDVTWLIVPWQLSAVGAGLAVAAVVARGASLPEAWEDWRKIVEARDLWEPRWMTLKTDPAPYLTGHSEIPLNGELPLTIDSFEAPGNLGAQGVISLAPKFAPVVGGGYQVVVLNENETTSDGQPVPGVKSPTKVSVVAWPRETGWDPEKTTPEQFQVLLRAAASSGIEAARLPQPMLLDTELISGGGEGEPRAWRTLWAAEYPAEALGYAAGQLGAMLDVDVLVDVREQTIYLGQAALDEMEFTDPEIPKKLEQLRRESEWGRRWTDALKQGEQPPVVQHAVYETRTLAGGQVLHSQPFMTKQAINSEGFMTSEKERKLSSTLLNAPFVSMQRWDGRSDRAGERHLGAFRVVWSHDPVPSSPADIAPGADRVASLWAITKHVTDGFEAAKLARPEVISVTPMTGRRADKHIWDIRVRLYGDVSPKQVKEKLAQLRNGMGAVPWLRVTETSDGCRIVAGTHPRTAQFARPAFRDDCTALDWEQAFYDAKVVAPGGQVPVLESTEPLPKNPKVHRMVFKLPPGLDRQAIRNAKKTLMPATGNVYLEEEAGPTPDTVAVICCPEQPVPFPAPFDWEAVAESDAIPFASGVTGEPIEYDWRLDPHLILLGGTGSGKSASMSNLIAGALIRGADVYIADPTKGCADFMFSAPWVKAMATTDAEASAMMDHVYREIVRRKTVNASHAAASYLDLPEEIRPPHIVVLIDEFTSLMFTEKLTRPPQDASEEQLQMFAEQEASNRQRLNIGGKAGRIVREARSAGVTLILAGQELKQDTLQRIPGGTSIKNNSSSLLLGKATNGSRMSALKSPFDAPELGDDVPRGRGLFESTAAGAQVIQSWFDAPDHTGSLAAHIGDVRAPLADEERVNLAALTVTSTEPVFGQRIDDEPEDDLIVDDVVEDLGVVELDFGGLFDDEEAMGELDDAAGRLLELPSGPATQLPSETTVPREEIIVTLTGPGDDGESEGISIDDLPHASEIITGVPLLDTIICWVIEHPTDHIRWVSPIAFKPAPGGIAMHEALAANVEIFGVLTVTPEMPVAADATEPTTVSAPVVTSDPPRPLVATRAPIPPPPPAPAEDDLFATRRNRVDEADMF